jgi:hypothetical protein
MAVYFNDYTNGDIGEQGTIQYAGLAPGLLGYQLNVTIPTSVGPSINPGVYLEIVTDAADVNQVQIPVSGATASARPALRVGSAQSYHRSHVTPRRRSVQPSQRGSIQ